jgi:hypothetical protein
LLISSRSIKELLLIPTFAFTNFKFLYHLGPRLKTQRHSYLYLHLCKTQLQLKSILVNSSRIEQFCKQYSIIACEYGHNCSYIINFSIIKLVIESSLCSVVYKIIAKIIVKRFNLFLSLAISSKQFFFLDGKQIHEAIGIAKKISTLLIIIGNLIKEPNHVKKNRWCGPHCVLHSTSVRSLKSLLIHKKDSHVVSFPIAHLEQL